MTVEPAWLDRARAELGIRETPGPVFTPQVMAYRKMAGLSGIKGDDSDVPWCAIFVGAMLRQAGLKTSGSALARSYMLWGKDCPVGTPGAVTVISSPRGAWTGHVFFATGRLTPTHIEGLGGNQADAVNIQWWARSRTIASRWPAELQPPLGKPVLIAATAPTHAVSDA